MTLPRAFRPDHGVATRQEWGAGAIELPGRNSALGSRLSALGSRLSALGSRLSALGSRLSALGSRLSALGSRLSALGSRLSALGSRLSALGSRLSALGSRTSGNDVCRLANVKADTLVSGARMVSLISIPPLPQSFRPSRRVTVRRATQAFQTRRPRFMVPGRSPTIGFPMELRGSWQLDADMTPNLKLRGYSAAQPPRPRPRDACRWSPRPPAFCTGRAEHTQM